LQNLENEIILDEIIHLFEHLVNNGVPLTDAYSLVVEQFGEDKLIEHLHLDNIKNLI
jgi:hypothetical protein